MNRSLRLFRTGVSVVTLALVGCGSSSPSVTDGGKTDGAAGSKTDGSAGAGGSAGSKTDGSAGTGGSAGAGAAAGKGGGSGAAGETGGKGGSGGGATAGSGGNAGAKGGNGGATAGTSGGTAGTGGEKTDGGNADAGGVLPVTALTATVLDRRATTFTLAWTAPTGGPTVTGYQVRYAKVPITAANFDDTAVTTALAYTGTPKAPGTADGMITAKLYIETGYYFAVEATDSAGVKSPIVSTTAAMTAHFNVKMIGSPTGTNQSFGATLDGSGDFNGDGLSDLLVGTFGDDQAYLFFGSATFSPTAPSVTFSGANMGFGSTVSRIGDIDHDGLQDLAIADSTGLQVFIYKGRTTWPATLTDAQADYVITSDATYVGSLFGLRLAALGDFDGDGVDDFAIGAPGFNTRVGQVAVIYGRSGFTSFGLPSTTRALIIAGDPALDRTQFGTAVVGLGHFYNLVTSTTMVVSATGLGTATTASDNEGRLYAFSGRGAGAAISATAASEVRVGPAKGAEIGSLLSNLGPIESSLAAVGSGNTADSSSVTGDTGTGFVLSGTAATGPLSNLLVTYQSGTSISGQVFFGGGFSGLDISVSLIGAAGPDLAIAGEQNGSLDIFDGAKIAALTGPVDSKLVADVHVPMPSGWIGTAAGPGNLIPDINGDGYPDFALGDQFGTVPGSVGVFW